MTMALAMHGCTCCHGLGMVGPFKRVRPCNCVLRRIFRICLNKYLSIADNQHTVRTGAAWMQLGSCPLGAGQVTSRKSSNRQRRNVWSRPHEEFLADVEILARRTLNPRELRLFQMYHLAALDWKATAPRLGFNRGEFFHAVYRTEQKLGRVFAETQPYGLYPVDGYFFTNVSGKTSQKAAASKTPEPPDPPAVSVALRAAA
jgi:hypothetical protein